MSLCECLYQENAGFFIFFTINFLHNTAGYTTYITDTYSTNITIRPLTQLRIQHGYFTLLAILVKIHVLYTVFDTNTSSLRYST